jgi:hypothetical protein
MLGSYGRCKRCLREDVQRLKGLFHECQMKDQQAEKDRIAMKKLYQEKSGDYSY